MNNLSLLQLLCSQVCFLMENTLQCSDTEFKGRLLKCFSLISTVKHYLNWDDKSLLHFYKEVVKKTLNVAPELTTHIWNGIIDVSTNTTLLKSTEELGALHELNKVTITENNEDVDISYALICSRLLTSKKLEDHLDLFLLCFHNNIHALNCILVSNCVEYIYNNNT